MVFSIKYLENAKYKKRNKMKSTIKRSFLVGFLALLIPVGASAQSPKQILAAVNQKFMKVNDYSANIHLVFNLPSVTIQPIDGKVYFKKPAKFRIKTKGIIFLPKQNPYYSLAALSDTNSYTAFTTGEEKIGSTGVIVIKVSPNADDNDLILGKFWIDKANSIVLKSQLTTRSSGTIQTESSYGANANVAYALPDKMTLSVDMTKFKIPKMVSADINSKPSHSDNEPRKGTGVITLSYSGYAINQKVPDSVFTEEVTK
ncbi:MAG: hypothetical protein JWO03_447 [Bacteroidetes bacterium]|nr:hypothetical protein [Bacteroidota bacterium]